VEDGWDKAFEGLHFVAVILAFLSDVLKPKSPAFTKRLAVGGAGCSAASLAGIEYGIVPWDTGTVIVVFSALLAVLSGVMLILQHAKGEKGESEGALAALIPAVERLQRRLGIIEGTLGDIKQDTAALRDAHEDHARRVAAQHQEVMAGQAATQEQLQELKQLVDALGKDKAAQAAEAGLGRETILQLARRMKPEVIGFEQAIKELEYAVGIALDVIARGERGTNQEAFVEDVLKRLAETTRSGEYDAGSEAVDEALAELDQSHRRSRETLLEAGVEQDLLRRDPAAVAGRIESLAALDTTEGSPVWSPKFSERQDAFYEEGDAKGINLSLEVAIEMARRMVASAGSADQRGTALNLLGNALQKLGARESGTARLEEAVTAYREALKERTQERVPLDWAMSQNNLGNALQTLGARESGTARLEGAVAAYREALKERTQERVPLDWATSTGNQGVAMMRLAGRKKDPAMAAEAVRQIEAALEVSRTGGHAPQAAYLDARLPEARALVERLSNAQRASQR